MKKHFMVLLAIFIFFASGVFADERNKENQKPSLNDLVVLDKNSVKTYEGHKFDVTWLNGLPMINIDFVQINAETAKVIGFKNVVSIIPDKSTWDQLKVKLELTALKNFKGEKITQEGPENEGYCEGELYQFDVYNSKNVLRISEWRDASYGFPIKKIIYTDDGKPINMVFYYQLEINKSFTPINNSQQALVLSLNKAVEKFGSCQFEDHEDIVRFCVQILSQALNFNYK